MVARRNRVDPFGDLYADAGRGLLTGNRGCLVDCDGVVRRHHVGRAWILCELEFRDWRHPLDEPHTWTPLFFLDDAVGLAAGHRPCGLCRRCDHLAYRDAVGRSVPGAVGPSALELDRRLASERLARGRGLCRRYDRILWRAPIDTLPTGTVIIEGGGEPSLVTARHVQPFGFDGWSTPSPRPTDIEVDVLTPPTSVAALRSGFEPRLHPTASA